MFSSRSPFDKLFAEATNTNSTETDWTTVVKICEMIRQGEIQPKYVLAQIKKKSTDSNPQTALLALKVLELCVKNCGCLVHDEISTQAYMEQLTNVVKTTQHNEVKNKILELLQAWAFVFKDTHKYRIILDTVNAMKTEGYTFPKMKESDAVFSTEIAPEWTTGLNCSQCGAQFGVILRRHHCRACGKVFCGQCSSKTCPLPRFGIEKEVRVCDHCHLKQKYNRAPTSDDISIEYACGPSDLLDEISLIKKLNENLSEEEAIQLALALSQSEAERRKEDDSARGKCDNEVTRSEPSQSPSSSTSEDQSSQYIWHQCQSCGQEFYTNVSANKSSHSSKFKAAKVVKLCDKCKEKHCTPLFSKPKQSEVKLEEVPFELPDPEDHQMQVSRPSKIYEEMRDDELRLETHRSPPLSLSEPESTGTSLSPSEPESSHPSLSPSEPESSSSSLSPSEPESSSSSLSPSEPESSHPFLPQFEHKSSQDIDDTNNDQSFEETVEVAEEAKYYYESETHVSSLGSNGPQEPASTEVNDTSRIEGDTSSECSSKERFQMFKDQHNCTDCNEFTLFGLQVAAQLNKLSTKKALEVQRELQAILTQARIDELSWTPLEDTLSSLQRTTSALSHEEVDFQSSKESLKEQDYVPEMESSA